MHTKKHRSFSAKLVITFLLATGFTPFAQSEEMNGAKALFFKGNEAYDIQAQLQYPEKVTQKAEKIQSKESQPGLLAKNSPSPVNPTANPVVQKKPKAPVVLGLQAWVRKTQSDGSSLKVSPVNTTFKEGDRIRLGFRTNTTGHLYVVNVGSTGKVTVLYPRGGAGNLVPAFSDLELNSTLVFDRNPGTEQLAVILAKEPLQEVTLDTATGPVSISLAPNAPTVMVSALPPVADAVSRAASAETKSDPGQAPKKNASLALADLRGAKDLKFEDDGAMVTVVMAEDIQQVSLNTSPTRKSTPKPMVMNLHLKHQ
jgi:hypothetical protein